MLPAHLLLQNRYRITQPIGQGGMGAVYAAIDQRLGHTVAIKQIIRGDTQAFEREARLLARLHHPSLPKVSDHFIEDAGQFLVMEFIPGDDLATARLRHPTHFTPQQVHIWGEQLLDALTYLHNQQPPILHRDIKPANLKLNERNKIVLLDFGLAKGNIGETSEPQKSAAGYTLAYASPEQIRGEGTNLRSDLYSAAATLFYLFTGSYPPDAMQRALALAAGRPDPLFSQLSQFQNLPFVILAVLRKAMQLDPAERFPHSQAMRTALSSDAQPTELGVTTANMEAQPVARPSASIPHNLPVQLTPLIGRQGDVTTLQQWLLDDTIRLVTLTGAGGSGKTRLALEVAHALQKGATVSYVQSTPLFSNGIYFVALDSVYEPTLAASAIAQTIGIKEAAGKPLVTTLQEFLRDKRMLLVLDNFEQIIPAALLLSQILTGCPFLKMIITSREVLRMRGEREYSVPLLDVSRLPEASDLITISQSAAVQLFLQSAQTVKANFVLDEANAQSVAKICIQLDGLPLAIELAAARIKLLTPQAILARLQDRFAFLNSGARDLPDRQRTLKATVDWSYALLSPGEQALFRRLAIFVGGRTLDAIEAVCDANDRETLDKDIDLQPLTIDVLEGLASLIDKNLIHKQERTAGEPRFVMLATIHEYALSRLEESQEAEIMHQCHGAFFLALAEQAEAELRGLNQRWWLDRLTNEQDNFRAALHWSFEQTDADIPLRFCAALWRFWEMHGDWYEGRNWLTLVLQRQNLPSLLRAKALIGAGSFARSQGDHEQAITLLQEALAIFQTTQDRLGSSNALTHLGRTMSAIGDFRHATQFLEQGLTLRRALNDHPRVADSLEYLGHAAKSLGDYSRARLLYEESLGLRRRLNDQRGLADSLDSLGTLIFDQNNPIEAQTYFEESLALRQKSNDNPGLVRSLNGLGRVAQMSNEYDLATSYYGQCLAIYQELGNKTGIATVLNNLGTIAFDCTDFKTARVKFQQSLNIYRQLNNKFGIALVCNNLGQTATFQEQIQEAIVFYRESLLVFHEIGEIQRIGEVLTGIGGVARTQNRFESAVILFGFAEALVEKAGASLPPSDLIHYERQKLEVRQKVGEEVFVVAWSSGQKMTIKQAIDYAISVLDNSNVS